MIYLNDGVYYYDFFFEDKYYLKSCKTNDEQMALAVEAQAQALLLKNSIKGVKMQDIVRAEAALLSIEDDGMVFTATAKVENGQVFGTLKIYKDCKNRLHNFPNEYVFNCSLEKARYSRTITVSTTKLTEALEKDGLDEDYMYSVEQLFEGFIKDASTGYENIGDLLVTHSDFIDENDVVGNRYTEKLYKTTSGQFLLHGAGGEYTQYQQGMPPIQWLSIMEAIEWTEWNANDCLKVVFGEPTVPKTIDNFSEKSRTICLSKDGELNSFDYELDFDSAYYLHSEGYTLYKIQPPVKMEDFYNLNTTRITA